VIGIVNEKYSIVLDSSNPEHTMIGIVNEKYSIVLDSSNTAGTSDKINEELHK